MLVFLAERDQISRAWVSDDTTRVELDVHGAVAVVETDGDAQVVGEVDAEVVAAELDDVSVEVVAVLLVFGEHDGVSVSLGGDDGHADMVLRVVLEALLAEADAAAEAARVARRVDVAPEPVLHDCAETVGELVEREDVELGNGTGHAGLGDGGLHGNVLQSASRPGVELDGSLV